MEFLHTIDQNHVKSLIQKGFEKNQIPHSQCIVDQGGRGGLALALDCALHLLWDEIPDSREKALQHTDLHYVYPVTTSANVKTKPKCGDYLPEWRLFLKEHLYGRLSDWLSLIGSENKQGNIGVDEAEDLFKRLSLKAFGGKNKVCILWGVEQLNIGAANKLLKLIEEPPANTYFIFVVEHAENLLTTIRSRCQFIQLPPLSESVIKNELLKKGVAEETASAMAASAEGSLDRALNLLLQKEEIQATEALLIECLRMSFRAGGNPSISIELMQWANAVGQMGRPRQKEFLRFGLQFMRQALLRSYRANELVHFQSMNNFSLEKFAPFVHSGNAKEIVSLFENALYAVERNGNGKIIFTDFCLSLTRLLNTKET